MDILWVICTAGWIFYLVCFVMWRKEIAFHDQTRANREKWLHQAEELQRDNLGLRIENQKLVEGCGRLRKENGDLKDVYMRQIREKDIRIASMIEEGRELVDRMHRVDVALEKSLLWIRGISSEKTKKKGPDVQDDREWLRKLVMGEASGEGEVISNKGD